MLATELRFMPIGVFALLFFVAIQAIEILEEDSVLVLTEDNFKDATDKYDFLLVNFYAPWCAQCKTLAPEYAKAAQQLKEENSGIKLGKVDATVHGNLATKYGVRGYPTIKFLRPFSEIDYNGGYDKDSIVNWLKEKSGPPAKPVTTYEEVLELQDNNEVLVVGYFTNSESEAAKTYLSVAGAIDDITFVITSEPVVANKLELTNEGIVLLKKFDEGRNVFEGTLDFATLKNFVQLNRLPLIIEFTQDSAQHIFGSEIKQLLFLFISKFSNEATELLEQYKEAVAPFKGKLLYIYIDIDNLNNQRIMELFGLKESDCPSMRIIILGEDMVKFKPDTSEINKESITAFLTNFLDGKLRPYFKSEEIPDDWDKNPVKILVGKNFDEVTKNTEADVFVFFYALWSEHCEQLMPIWEKLAEKYIDNDNLIIAKMDAIANEVEGMRITSFPTLKFFLKDSGEIIDFTGERTLDSLSKFIESGGTEDAV